MNNKLIFDNVWENFDCEIFDKLSYNISISCYNKVISQIILPINFLQELSLFEED